MNRLMLPIGSLALLLSSAVWSQDGGGGCLDDDAHQRPDACERAWPEIPDHWANPIPDNLWTPNGHSVTLDFEIDLSEFYMNGTALVAEVSQDTADWQEFPIDGEDVVRIWLTRSALSQSSTPFELTLEYGVYDIQGGFQSRGVAATSALLAEEHYSFKLLFNRRPNANYQGKIKTTITPLSEPTVSTTQIIVVNNLELRGVVPKTLVFGLLDEDGLISSSGNIHFLIPT